MADFKTVAAQAQKILGDKAKVPNKLSPAILKGNSEVNVAFKKYTAIVKQLESAILALQDAATDTYNAGKQFSIQIEKSDFGMDKKADDYKKKRAEAQKLFDSYFQDAFKDIEGTIKDLDELDKHLEDLKDYKSPPDAMDK